MTVYAATSWHQWQAAYPTLRRTGTSRARASSKASGDHSHQSTGLSLCCRRYGDVALASRLAISSDSSRVAGGGPSAPSLGGTRMPARRKPTLLALRLGKDQGLPEPQ